MIDLRSDTVTRPTPGMLDAMMHAEVGDDVFGDDPTVKKLEAKCAKLLGMDAAVYCPSGTMTNQIGIKVLTQPYDEVICYEGSHIYMYEGGGVAGNSGSSVKLLKGDRGRISIDEIGASINHIEDPHYPRSAVVSLENTIVREAGSYYKLDQIGAIYRFVHSKGLKMHLDGARLFNAITETKDHVSDYGQFFDTISICLSKGLGAPVGSVLACRKELELPVRRMRKVFGGGMRQAGFLAAAGIFALDNHIARLSEDHRRARALGKALASLPYVQSVLPVDTNIIVFELTPNVGREAFLTTAAKHDVHGLKFKNGIRFVTHLDFDDAKLDQAIDILSKLSF